MLELTRIPMHTFLPWPIASSLLSASWGTEVHCCGLHAQHSWRAKARIPLPAGASCRTVWDLREAQVVRLLPWDFSDGAACLFRRLRYLSRLSLSEGYGTPQRSALGGGEGSQGGPCREGRLRDGARVPCPEVLVLTSGKFRTIETRSILSEVPPCSLAALSASSASLRAFAFLPVCPTGPRTKQAASGRRDPSRTETGTWQGVHRLELQGPRSCFV